MTTPPTSEGWITWDSKGECPVDPKTKIDIRCQDGLTNTCYAGDCIWGEDEEGFFGVDPIIAYRLAAAPTPDTGRLAEDEAREAVAAFMLKHSFATGHGDTLEDLLGELGAQVNERQAKADDQAERIREALSVYDKAIKACPAMTRFLGDQKCPKCGVGRHECCGLEIQQSDIFIGKVRQALGLEDSRHG